VLIQISPKESVAYVAQLLKGGTSRVLRSEFPDLEEFLWGDSFWADGYFAETVGQVDEEVVRRYIQQQR
jgi:putative transposase